MATKPVEQDGKVSTYQPEPIPMTSFKWEGEVYLRKRDVILWLDRLALTWHKPFMRPSAVVKHIIAALRETEV